MRFFAAFTLLLVAIATVQSNPIIPQVNDLNALVGAFPQELINQLHTVGAQIASVLTPNQLQILEQQAILLADKVLNGKIDINTAANQLFQQVQQYLGSNSPLLNNIKPFMQQLLSAIATVLPNLSVNIGTRSANMARTDLSALINQLPLNNLNAILAANPQLASLLGQLQTIAAQVEKALSPAQLQLLQQQAMQFAEDVFNGNVDINTALNQLLQQAQQYLGSNSQILNNVQPLVQQLLNAVFTVFPNWSSGFGQTRTIAARTDLSALINQLPLDNLNAILAANPQFASLLGQLQTIAAQIVNALSPAQLQLLEQQAMQLAQNVFNGNVDVNTALNQLLQQVQQYLGNNSQILNNVQPLVQQLLDAVFTVFPNFS